MKKLSEYVMDGDNGLFVYFHEEPPEDVPEWDKIRVLMVRDGKGKEHWIHEEEALSLISGLAQGVVEIQTRKPIRDWVNNKTEVLKDVL